MLYIVQGTKDLRQLHFSEIVELLKIWLVSEDYLMDLSQSSLPFITRRDVSIYFGMKIFIQGLVSSFLVIDFNWKVGPNVAPLYNNATYKIYYEFMMKIFNTA